MEELEERHQVEIKVYKQKVKHLLYEHQNNVSQLKEECEVSTAHRASHRFTELCLCAAAERCRNPRSVPSNCSTRSIGSTRPNRKKINAPSSLSSKSWSLRTRTPSASSSRRAKPNVESTEMVALG